MTPSNKLTEPATADLSGSASTAEMAKREGEYDPDKYALCLAHHIRNDGVSLDTQRERLAALAGMDLEGAKASAQELARHYAVLHALFDRFSLEAVRATGAAGNRGAEAADKLMNAGARAQKAALGVLSALKVLREEVRTGGGASPHPVDVNVDPPDSASTQRNRTDAPDNG